MGAEASLRRKKIGLGLVVLSFALYGSLLLVPFTPFTSGEKIALSSALVILGEASFWVAALIMGRDVLRKYRKDPLKWLKQKV